jgi:hypothetical protein
MTETEDMKMDREVAILRGSELAKIAPAFWHKYKDRQILPINTRAMKEELLKKFKMK